MQWLPIIFRLKFILLPGLACKVLGTVPLSGCSSSCCLAIRSSLHNFPVILNLLLVAECFILWPLDEKSWLTRKKKKKHRHDAGKDWGQEEKGTPEDEMAGRHHRLDGRELKQALGVGDGQGGLACYSPWGCKESDTAKRLNDDDKCFMSFPFCLCIWSSSSWNILLQ